MAFTSHGHHIPNTPTYERPDSLRFVVRCSGVSRCHVCQEDVIRWNLGQSRLDAVNDHIPHELLQYFDFEHLPKELRTVSRPFNKLAEDLDHQLEDGSQKDLALTHLLQAKDAAVRAHVTWLKREGHNT